MSDATGNVPDSGDAMIYCPECGQAMLVRPEHVQVQVACPHCQQVLEPWRLVGTVSPGVTARYGPPPPPRHGVRYGQQTPVMYSWRNRWVAGILGVLLGPLGVHRFYLGFAGIGVLQILATVLTGVGALWGLIEGVLCLVGATLTHDVDGLPLRE